MSELIQAFTLIFIAEMGDKTQIMAMAFATKFKVKQILVGVFIGSLLNHGLAIALGSLLNRFIPLDALQLVAGVLFVAFGLMSLSIAEDTEEDDGKKAWGPVLTVAMAFFLGELGDKTQLTALTLATQSVYPVLVLAGTVLGMVVVSSFGIFIGSRMGDRVPEHIIKIMAFLIFMLFGLAKIYDSMYVKSMGTVFMTLMSVVIAILVIYRFIIFRRQLHEVSLTALRQKASELKQFRNRLEFEVINLCKGCNLCSESQCLVGYMKDLFSDKVNVEKINQTYIEQMKDREFDLEKTKTIIKMMDDYFVRYPEDKDEPSLYNIYNVLKQIANRKQ